MKFMITRYGLPISVLVFAAAAFLFAAPKALAATMYFATFQEFGTHDCLSSENSCTLQEAFDAAYAGDDDAIINLGGVTFTGEDTFLFDHSDFTHSLTLIGVGADVTVVTATGDGSDGIDIVSGGDVDVGAIDFHGNTDGGLSIYGPGSVNIHDNFFQNNNTSGLLVSHPSGSGTADISNNTFTGNSSIFNGGGLRLETTSGASAFPVTLTGNTFNNNTAAGSGGAVSISSTSASSPVLLNGNTFSGNTATSNDGGALYIFTTGTNSPITIGDGGSGHGNTFTSNSAQTSSGAFYLDTDGSGSPVTIENNTVGTTGHGNSSSDFGGGGKVFAGSGLTLTGNTFTDNTAGGNAGGLGVLIDRDDDNTSDNSIANNTFTNNTAQFDGGGLNLSVTYAGNLNVDANTFTSNTATAGEGGGLRLQQFAASSQVVMTNNLLVNNTSGTESGGFDYYDQSSAGLDFVNNTVADNIAGNKVGGANFGMDNIAADLNVYNNIFWGNTSNSAHDVHVDDSAFNAFNFNSNDSSDFCTSSSGCGTYSVSGFSAVNNLNGNPLFVDPDNGDYTLTELSPAVDLGNDAAPSLPGHDFTGSGRLQNFHVDMGAFELIIPHEDLTPYTLSVVTPIPAQVTGTTATYSFAINGSGEAEYIASDCGHGSNLLFTSPDTNLTAQGVQVRDLASGNTYTCSFHIHSIAGDSNSLTIGPFTVAHASSGRSHGSGTSLLTCANGKLIKYASGPAVYLIENCQKRAFVSGDAFVGLGYSWAGIVTAPDTEFYPSGPDMIMIAPPAPAIPAAAAKITVDLSIGMTNPQVSVLQRLLQAKGFFPATQTPVDHFGPITLAAVKAYQAANGIIQTGYVGPLTRAKLNL